MPTPGVILLTKGALLFTLPPLGIYTLYHRLISTYSPTHNPLTEAQLITLCALAVPIFAGLRIFVTLQYLRWRASRLGARMVPTPPDRWPGNLDVLQEMMELSRNGYPGDRLDEIMEDFDNVFNMRPMFQDLIVTIEPQYIKQILSSDFQNYVKGPIFQDATRSVLGHGVFNSDGDMWKFHRSMTRPFFSRDRISDFELFDRHADEIIDLMKRRGREGWAVDFQDAVSRFTLDSATEFLFGSSVHSMGIGLPYPYNAPAHLVASHPSTNPNFDASGTTTADAFATAFLSSQFIVSQRIRHGWVWPALEVLQEATTKPMDTVGKFVEPIVREAVRKNKELKASGGVREISEKERDVKDGETLLDHLVQITSDEKILKDETTNILIAGRDTTAAVLTFMFFFLAKYPHVAQRLRAEILETVGPNRAPTYEDVKEMKYLRAVINETLRLFPVVPFNIRETINETTWPSMKPGEKPYYIPAKTQVAYCVFLMHRRTDLWGPDAQEFDPDRFLDERLKTYLLKNNFIFLPFNAGPRICLGQQFAYNEMSFLTVRLMQHFRSFSLHQQSQAPDTLPPMEWSKDPASRKGRDGIFPKIHLTMYIDGGLWLKMEETPESERV